MHKDRQNRANKFNFAKNKRHPTSNCYYSWESLYNTYKDLEVEATFLLKLLYPDGVSNYIVKPNMYQFFYFVPSKDLYIDYYEFLSHQGPYNQKRVFNPFNIDDVKFVQEVNKFSKTKKRKYWLSVDRYNTWATTDYEKYLFMLSNHKNYKIYWTLQEIKNCCKSYMLEMSKAFNLVYLSTKNLENVYDKIILNDIFNIKIGV